MTKEVQVFLKVGLTPTSVAVVMVGMPYMFFFVILVLFQLYVLFFKFLQGIFSCMPRLASSIDFVIMIDFIADELTVGC